MKSTRIYVYTKAIDSNYSAAKDYIPIPSNVKRITSVCCVLHNAEGYISLLREIDETQILNEMRLEDSKQHIPTTVCSSIWSHTRNATSSVSVRISPNQRVI